MATHNPNKQLLLSFFFKFTLSTVRLSLNSHTAEHPMCLYRKLIETHGATTALLLDAKTKGCKCLISRKVCSYIQACFYSILQIKQIFNTLRSGRLRLNNRMTTKLQKCKTITQLHKWRDLMDNKVLSKSDLLCWSMCASITQFPFTKRAIWVNIEIHQTHYFFREIWKARQMTLSCITVPFWVGLLWDEFLSSCAGILRGSVSNDAF